MGFSSSLQGSSSHDAILQRVDAELRLLENMKRCLMVRVKADREYAISLNAFVMQSQKFDPNGDFQAGGSNVAKAWADFIEQTDKMSKSTKENADNLASATMDKLNMLYAVSVYIFIHVTLSCLCLLLFVFSACGGISTIVVKLPVLIAYSPVLAYSILGKGVLFAAQPSLLTLLG